MAIINRILCPVDFSETSTAAFRYADNLAAWANAEIILLHAFSDPVSYDDAGQWKPADPAVHEQLGQLKSNHANVVLTPFTHAGLPDEVICWAAEHEGCDLIVMGTHGRTGLKHLLFGSTAEAVLRNARCPVLTIRPQEHNLPKLQEPTVAPLPPPTFM